jgi:predicted component of type VI protein secretion system
MLTLESSLYSFRVMEATAPALIGRGDEARLRIPEDTISQKHAELSFEAGGWFVRDLGSRHGTTLNGKSVQDKTPLANGDILRLATFTFHVAVGEHASHEQIGADLAGGQLVGLIKAASKSRSTRRHEDPVEAAERARLVRIEKRALAAGLVIIVLVSAYAGLHIYLATRPAANTVAPLPEAPPPVPPAVPPSGDVKDVPATDAVPSVPPASAPDTPPAQPEEKQPARTAPVIEDDATNR